MSKEPELKARDKVVVRMTREGAVEENLTAGTEQRVSKRLEEAELVKPAETAAPSEALSAEEQKKVQMRRQQRQFQAEHAEDNDTQPLSEKQLTSRSLPEIGRKFDRDHTTVMHAVRKVEELILEDASLAENVDALRRILEA